MISTVELKAYLFYPVVKIFSTINLKNPFSLKVAISYVAFITGLVAMGGDIYRVRFGEKGISFSPI